MMARSDTVSMVHRAFAALNAAWEVWDATADPEFWDAANAQLSAAMSLAQAAVRDAKRAQGYPVHGSEFRLPWLARPRAARHPMARAS
ncbi:MAG: hypothetical protein K6V97_13890 [Actinomycetia bacterium]|nr:hypothetical protein [Actinomycetes bacterium]